MSARARAVLTAALLLPAAASCVRAQLPPAPLTEAERAQDLPFEEADGLPPGLRAALEARGAAIVGSRVVLPGGRALTRREAAELLGAWRSRDGFSIQKATEPRRGSVRDGMDGIDFDDILDRILGRRREPPGEGGGSGGAQPDRRGLRFLGIDLGSGYEPDQENEPFLKKGVEGLLDWDVRARIRLDSLGFKANYRHPGSLKSLSLSFRRFEDVPGLIGLEDARDRAYGWFGKEPPDKKGGYDADVSGTFDEYWGLGLHYGETTKTDDDSQTFQRGSRVTLGYTPLGLNEGRPWNYSLLGSVEHVELDERGGADPFQGSGFGWSLGVAFQHALNELPIPLLHESGFLKKNLRFDRFKASLGVADSEISSLAVRSSLAVTAWLTKNLELSAGVSAEWRPDPSRREEAFDIGPRFGISLRF